MTPNTGPNAATIAALLERAATHDRKHAAALESGGYTPGRPFFDDVRITHADAARALRAAADLLLCHDETGHDLCAWPVVAEFVSGLSGVDVEPVRTPDAPPMDIDPTPPSMGREGAVEDAAVDTGAFREGGGSHVGEPIGYGVATVLGRAITPCATLEGAQHLRDLLSEDSEGGLRVVALIPVVEP